MSVYLRHSLFWDVWDCYGKLMSEPQKSSMDWCSYIYIFNISPWFTMFFSMEEHLSDMSAVASTAFCSCQRLNPLWWCRAPKLLGSGTHIGDLMGRSGEWLDWARKRDEWRMMDDDGWMMDDDGWWWMMDDDGCIPQWWFLCVCIFDNPPFTKSPFWGPKPRCCAGIWRLPLLQRQPNGRERCPQCLASMRRPCNRTLGSPGVGNLPVVNHPNLGNIAERYHYYYFPLQCTTIWIFKIAMENSHW